MLYTTHAESGSPQFWRAVGQPQNLESQQRWKSQPVTVQLLLQPDEGSCRVWKTPLPFNVAHPAEDCSQYVVECDKLAEMLSLDVEHSRSEFM